MAVGPMKWTVVVPEAPPSVNHSYKIVRIGNHMRKAKTEEVIRFQALTAMLTRQAKPRNWQPEGQWIRLRYRFYLRYDKDCDNAVKALNDAIASALGVNDSRFLPCTELKSVNRKEPTPRVEVDIGDPSDWPS